ncbi:hypothetical protein [Rhizobium sp. CCGE 510]|uniref:hypothetical protein n=1 Tax=Rhizobium sp. CCGE 510 TaxID=1132836 RepID=UPI00027B8E28|nr:hypothetical protein [Rhizobium sp. CCGE 510]EJT05018.1 hypothetical protein RCCGE510_11184 [Rhizobium sp. CCGE 510]
MSDDEIWDREMTMDEFKRLDPALQKKRIDTSLRRKVTEMHRWSRSGVPTGIDWRKNGGDRTKLRRWHDPKKKLWSWSDDNPDHPRSRNKTVMAKWIKARNLLAAGRTAKPTDEKDNWKQRALALELQNSNLIAVQASLEDRLRRAEARIQVSKKKRASD